MAGNFNYFRIDTAADPELFGTALAVDFNSAIAMPPALDLEWSNVVETGYEAIHGDWRKVAAQWMFKEAASSLGLAFPPQSREDLLQAFRTMECWPEYKAMADRAAGNLAEHGFATREPWQLKHWGTEGNADGGMIEALEGRKTVWFIANKCPTPVLKAWSRRVPEIDLHVTYADDQQRSGKRFIVREGRIGEQARLQPEERKALVEAFAGKCVKTQ
ncbi:hypothetical protein [Duganella sp. Root1480D1]|uniref:hypothetical protein n=1 Tax=Duganella sp. Root1480D1 TaxID=1736471 RepID=UPI000709BF65|nr:hypothetical protein [Duganella sp. Root1480D1]KQZ45146.1 hypothetical protein ASD58_02575 [Duganella sp. Root1480D1]